MSRMHNPPHPGEVLQDWLEGISVTEAAKRLHVTRAHLSRLLNGHAGISADMALRLSALLGTSAEVWQGMQSAYDLWQAEQKPQPQIERLVA
ncbi:HigA family addiction module antitoxin [Andreprevotia chitinilytica]|uniref:HigA family addiction module antitoxin n=1 Tax=Andreprevotia chitinilytica TaxID=396808 RepID=UPI00054F21A7|nr:HigA family addiction module antitoxin [Andreprevotia chitinilytica]